MARIVGRPADFSRIQSRYIFLLNMFNDGNDRNRQEKEWITFTCLNVMMVEIATIVEEMEN